MLSSPMQKNLLFSSPPLRESLGSKAPHKGAFVFAVSLAVLSLIFFLKSSSTLISLQNRHHFKMMALSQISLSFIIVSYLLGKFYRPPVTSKPKQELQDSAIQQETLNLGNRVLIGSTDLGAEKLKRESRQLREEITEKEKIIQQQEASLQKTMRNLEESRAEKEIFFQGLAKGIANLERLEKNFAVAVEASQKGIQTLKKKLLAKDLKEEELEKFIVFLEREREEYKKTTASDREKNEELSDQILNLQSLLRDIQGSANFISEEAQKNEGMLNTKIENLKTKGQRGEKQREELNQAIKHLSSREILLKKKENRDKKNIENLKFNKKKVDTANKQLRKRASSNDKLINQYRRLVSKGERSELTIRQKIMKKGESIAKKKNTKIETQKGKLQAFQEVLDEQKSLIGKKELEIKTLKSERLLLVNINNLVTSLANLSKKKKFSSMIRNDLISNIKFLESKIRSKSKRSSCPAKIYTKK